MDSLFREGVLECDNPGTILDDDDIGPTNFTSDDVDSFIVFYRETGNSSAIKYTFNASTSSVRVTLYFFNHPDQSIGLPSISVTTTQQQTVPFTFSANDDLSKNDSIVRSVILHLNPNAPLNYFSLNVEFDDKTDINWCYISEVDITGGEEILASV